MADKSLKVLVVDDSPTDLAVLTRLLAAHGHTFLTAADADKAIALAKSESPDVILMDVVMPGQNGFQATRTLARDPQTSGIPVIIVSSKSQETDVIWGMRQGAKDYIVKPVDSALLQSKLRAVAG
jgi:twitching motility two-component system response regulator PilH